MLISSLLRIASSTFSHHGSVYLSTGTTGPNRTLASASVPIPVNMDSSPSSNASLPTSNNFTLAASTRYLVVTCYTRLAPRAYVYRVELGRTPSLQIVSTLTPPAMNGSTSTSLLRVDIASTDNIVMAVAYKGPDDDGRMVLVYVYTYQAPGRWAVGPAIMAEQQITDVSWPWLSESALIFRTTFGRLQGTRPALLTYSAVQDPDRLIHCL